MAYYNTYDYSPAPRSRVIILNIFRTKPTFAQVLKAIDTGPVYSISRTDDGRFKIVFSDHRVAERLVQNSPIKIQINEQTLDYVDAWRAPDENLPAVEHNASRILALTIPGTGKGPSPPHNSVGIIDLDGTFFNGPMLMAAGMATNDEAQHLTYLGLSRLCGRAVSVIRCMAKTEGFWFQLEFLSIPDAVRFWRDVELERKRAWIETDMAFLKIEGQWYDENDDGQVKIRYGTDEMQQVLNFDGSETTSTLTVVDREGTSENTVALPRIRWERSSSGSRERS